MSDAGIVTVGDVFIPQVISGLVVADALFANTPLLRSPYILDIAKSGVPYTDGGDTVKFLTQEFENITDRPKDYVKNLPRGTKTACPIDAPRHSPSSPVRDGMSISTPPGKRPPPPRDSRHPWPELNMHPPPR